MASWLVARFHHQFHAIHVITFVPAYLNPVAHHNVSLLAICAGLPYWQAVFAILYSRAYVPCKLRGTSNN